MNLRWKSFERAVRGQVRARILASTTLWKDYAQSRKRRRRTGNASPGLCHVMFLVMGVFIYLGQNLPVQVLMAFMVLWTAGAACSRASDLVIALYYSPRVHVLNYLPISDAAVFQVQWKRFLKSSLWSAVDFTVLYSLLVAKSGAGFAIVLTGSALGLIQWLFIVGAAVCLFGLFPWRMLFSSVALFLGAALAVLFLGADYPALTQPIANLAYWLPPLGWTLYALGISPSHGLPHDLVPCVISAALLAVAPFAYRRIRQDYTVGEESTAAQRPSPADNAVGYPELARRFASSLSDIKTAIQDAQFRSGSDWSKGGLAERCISWLLTSREQLIAEFLMAGVPRWAKASRSWLLAVLLAVVTWRLLFTWTGFQPTIVIFMCAYLLLSNFLGGWWRGLGCPAGRRPQSPFYALYPISVWDLIRVTFKLNLLIYSVLALVIAVALGCVNVVAPSGGDVWPLTWKVISIGMLAQPIASIGLISFSTNDSQNPKYLLLALTIIFALVGSVIAFFLASTLKGQVIAGLIFEALSVGTLFLYARFFDCSRFDLLPAAKTHL